MDRKKSSMAGCCDLRGGESRRGHRVGRKRACPAMGRKEVWLMRDLYFLFLDGTPWWWTAAPARSTRLRWAHGHVDRHPCGHQVVASTMLADAGWLPLEGGREAARNIV
jgi:hypothetical protein